MNFPVAKGETGLKEEVECEEDKKDCLQGREEGMKVKRRGPWLESDRQAV